MRLRQLQPWIDGWKVDELNAGIRGRGAERAWLEESVRIEQALLQGRAVIATTYDTFKAFDQINRRVLYCVLVTMGAPRQVLHAFAGFTETLFH